MFAPTLQKLDAEEARTAVATHCPYCALQCGMTLVSDAGNWSVEPRDFPTNSGGLCQKGWTAAELLNHPERLRTPWMRPGKNAALIPVSWDEALQRVTEEIERIQARYGNDAMGVFGGGGLTNEKAYLLGKFARVALRTSQIDYNGRFCMSSAAAASIKAFGVDRGLPFPLADIPFAEVVLMMGSNAAETMPPIMQYFQAQERNGGQLIVVDPRRTPTAAAAALHLQITPGTDAALLNGLLHLAIRQRYVDCDYIAARTKGFDAVKRAVSSYWPDRVERITGVPGSRIEAAARMLGEASTAIFLTGRGPEQQSHGVDNVTSVINLALALGKVGKPFSGYGCLTGQGNGQGGREHGQKADQLPGYRKIDNPVHRRHIANVWGIDEGKLPGIGKSAYELLDGLGTEGGVRGLLVLGSNPVVSVPRANHIENRLRALDFLVVSDFFLSESAKLADVVLPCTQWAEEEGTMTNLEGRVLFRQKARQPIPGVRSDLEILSELARRLHAPSAFPSEPAEVFEELRRASAGGAADYAGITYERITAQDGVFWPCQDENKDDTPRLFLDRFPTPDGRARFYTVEHRGPREEPDGTYPLYLTTGRMLPHYQSGTQTLRVEKLRNAASESYVEMHPATAATYGLAQGDLVRLTTRRGQALARARLTTTIRLDTVFMPFHFAAAGRANLLTNPALDPISKMPEFKVCAVQIERETRPC